MAKTSVQDGRKGLEKGTENVASSSATSSMTKHLKNKGIQLEPLKSLLVRDIPAIPEQQLYQGTEQIVQKMLQQQILVTV